MTGRISDDHAIGVGMGGSCPECNAPVDLGQEFCLECGAPIRAGVAARRRRQQRAGQPASTPGSGTATAALSMPAGRRGFPWVPFLVVLALAVVGVVFAMLSGDDDARSGSRDPQTDAGGISTLSTETAPSSTQTVVSTGCTPGVSTNTDGTTTFGSTGATTPTLSTNPDDAADPAATPSTVPTFSTPTATTPDGSAEDPAVTVNERGELCGSSGGSETVPTTPPASTTPTTSTTPGTATTPTTSGSTSGSTGATGVQAEEWPSGTSGYTVVLASFSQKNYRKADAQIRATQAQSNGISSGVLDSNDFSSLTANLWVVFSGIHDTQDAAEAHEREVRAAGYQGAYVREVKP